jgi:cysteinyl-tRNA synthetase
LISKATVINLPSAFIDAMNSDLNVPGALAVLHETVRAGNAAIDSKETDLVATYLSQVIAMAQVLGLILEQPKEVSAELAQKIEELISLRATAKANKDFGKADQIRDELTKLGVTLEDLPNQTIWSING